VPSLPDEHAPPVPDALEALADRAAIVEFAEWAQAWATAHALNQELGFALRLCVEEAVTNIVFYAYDGVEAANTVGVSAALGGGAVTLTISDLGRPFDVAAAADPGREGDIQTATVGGRGIRLIRAFSDKTAYARVGPRNQLTLTFLTDAPPEDAPLAEAPLTDATGPDR